MPDRCNPFTNWLSAQPDQQQVKWKLLWRLTAEAEAPTKCVAEQLFSCTKFRRDWEHGGWLSAHIYVAPIDKNSATDPHHKTFYLQKNIWHFWLSRSPSFHSSRVCLSVRRTIYFTELKLVYWEIFVTEVLLARMCTCIYQPVYGEFSQQLCLVAFAILLWREKFRPDLINLVKWRFQFSEF